MSDINSVRNKSAELNKTQIGQVDTGVSQNQNKTKENTSANENQRQRHSDGVAEKTVTQKLMPDAITGKDPSQLLSVDKLSEIGSFSSTEKLLGLDQRPTILGILPPPVGNQEALKHLSPAMRRTILRNLINKQRDKMKHLAFFVRKLKDEAEDEESSPGKKKNFLAILEDENFDEENLSDVDRAISEIAIVANMLDTLNELLTMQDYTISQVGAFSQG